MISKDIKAILIGIIIAWVTNPVIIFFHTLIEQLSYINFHIPLPGYFLYGYSPLAIVGIYIAFAKTNHRIFICMLIGIIYAFSRILFDHYISNFEYIFYRHLEYVSLHFLINFINMSILYSIMVAGTCTITYYIKNK